MCSRGKAELLAEASAEGAVVICPVMDNGFIMIGPSFLGGCLFVSISLVSNFDIISTASATKES